MSDTSATSSRKRADDPPPDRAQRPERKGPAKPAVPEIGGPPGPEPTRYGDWEKGGRCSDF